MTDYAKLAEQFGGKVESGPVDFAASQPDYATLAKQYGGAVVEEPRSAMGELGRQLGLTARAGVKGVTYPGRLIGDVMQLGSTAALDRLMDMVGLPKPENATERFAGDVAEGMAGAATGVGIGGAMSGAASPVVRGVGGMLETAPGMQVIGGATGAGAGSATRESGGGPWAQMGASLLGGAAPAVGTASLAEMTRRAARGGEAGRLATADMVGKGAAQGVDLSAGQASGARVLQAGESIAGKTLMGMGVMARRGEQTAGQMGDRVSGLADEIAPSIDATRAGHTIEKGLKGFMERFRTQQSALYDKLDEHIPAAKPIEVENTRAALGKLNSDIPGATALSALFRNENAKMQSIQGALESDVAGSMALPYEAVKQLRTRVGEKLSNPSLTNDVPRAQWKALYGALSQDLEGAAAAAGPKAQQAFSRANDFTRAGHDRIEGFLDRVANGPTYEKIFKAVTNPAEIKEGASTVNAIMRSLQPDERKAVTAAFVRRLGQAKAGVQDDTGEVFSPRTFLTQYASISAPAKAILFGAHTGDLRKNLDQLAEIASVIDRGAKVMQGQSGTPAAVIPIMGQVGGLAGAVMAEHYGSAAVILASLPASYGGAKLLTNPEFVRWLARSTKVSPGMLPGQLAALSTLSNRMPDELKPEVSDYIKRVGAIPTQQGLLGTR